MTTTNPFIALYLAEQERLQTLEREKDYARIEAEIEAEESEEDKREYAESREARLSFRAWRLREKGKV